MIADIFMTPEEREIVALNNDLRRSQAAALWQSWGALAAMAAVHHDGWCVGNADGASRATEVFAPDVLALRRLESLRTWQAWSGVLVMVACVEHEREAHWSAGYDEGCDIGHAECLDQEFMDRDLME